MSKKYTAKVLNQINKDILANAFQHMETLVKELHKLDQSDKEKLNKETQGRIGLLNSVLTLMNDIIHPAHALAYQHFKGYETMLDLYVKNQKLAFENKVIPECYNNCCDPDGSKSYAKAQELAKKDASVETV